LVKLSLMATRISPAFQSSGDRQTGGQTLLPLAPPLLFHLIRHPADCNFDSAAKLYESHRQRLKLHVDRDSDWHSVWYGERRIWRRAFKFWIWTHSIAFMTFSYSTIRKRRRGANGDGLRKKKGGWIMDGRKKSRSEKVQRMRERARISRTREVSSSVAGRSFRRTISHFNIS